jgi:hypothetical protein
MGCDGGECAHMADMLASTLGEDVKAHLPPHTRGVLSHTVPKERVGVGVTSTVHRERKVM